MTAIKDLGYAADEVFSMIYSIFDLIIFTPGALRTARENQ